jgi:hypothetical protein
LVDKQAKVLKEDINHNNTDSTLVAITLVAKRELDG